MDQRTEEARGLLRNLEGVDLGSADGRAGLGALLREIERMEPGIVQRICAESELRRLNLPMIAAR